MILSETRITLCRVSMYIKLCSILLFTKENLVCFCLLNKKVIKKYTYLYENKTKNFFNENE